VFDHVPENAPYPFLSLGAWNDGDGQTGPGDIREHRFRLYGWSKKAGRREAADMADAVRTVLHDATLSVTDHHLVSLRVEGTEITRDPAAGLYRAEVRLRALTEPL
ncbi:MAG: DUF3168 domain-containing protein, partial [Pseudomonadota bacterium]